MTQLSCHATQLHYTNKLIHNTTNKCNNYHNRYTQHNHYPNLK